MGDASTAIELQQIGTRFGSHTVHEGLDLCVRRGEILGLAGGSGSGKSVPLREQGGLGDEQVDRIAEAKLAQTGLPPEAGLKLPAELSGGMLKRAALARAIALDPELLFLDEPTSGLDPASSAGVDELILATHARYGPTLVIVSHDLDLLWQVCDRVAVLGEGRVLALGSMTELAGNDHPIVAAYFTDRRRAHAPAVRAAA